MSPEMNWLIVAVGFWLVLHLGLAGSPLRWVVARRIGEDGFRILFSALSAIGLVWLARTYGAASTHETFYGLRVVETWMLWVPALVMPVALFFFVGAVTMRNPTAVGAAGALAQPEPARGVLRITRHPMLWAFALWAGAHLLANGDLASSLFFASIILTAVAGMFSIDRKRARTGGADWQRFEAVTSILPFAAIRAGRNRLVASEIGWWRVALAAALWGVLVAIHGLVFETPALPV
ncbi:MAG: NnrU family protein [Proteobacteria bacterium]|nr:NnrU family protein [Pseudomonadota bacterium]MBI3499680.1 NnrU family protein [Pseudomonadota bacterium]